MKKELNFLVILDESDEMFDALRYASLRAARVSGKVVLLYTFDKIDFSHWKAVENIAEKESDRKSIELIGTLPEWDLTDLYMDQDAPEIGKDIKNLCLNVKSFSKDYQGKRQEVQDSQDED